MVATDTRIRVNAPYTHLLHYGPRYEVIMGGAGSGKSYAVAQHIILAALDPAHRGRKYLVVRKVARTLRYSVYALLRDLIVDLGLTPYFEINKTEMTFTSVTGTQILLLGLDDVEKLKSIHGVTDVWCEEATEMAESDLKQLNLRLRGQGHAKRIVLTFNPISQLHWLKRRFFDRQDDSARVTVTTYKDNAFLDDAYKAELEGLKDKDAYFYQVYTLGEWGQLGNTVFSNYVIEDFDYGADDLENVRQGMDFGYNDPTVLTRSGFKDGDLYTFDELYLLKNTNTQLIETIMEWYDYANNLITADSAEPARIAEISRAGIPVQPAKKGKDSIRSGIDFIKRHRWHIHATRCPNLAKEVQAYKWREDRDGNVMDEPVDLNNHCIDSVRYALEDAQRPAPRVSVI